ncbi:MAG: protein adenylyltransferase SelO [Hyphomicrobiaceae bacterium]
MDRPSLPQLNFDNTFAAQMRGFYVPWQAARVPAPKLVILNAALARELGLDPSTLDTESLANALAGNELLDGASPLAQVYAGHQFGHFSEQLGDGRALLLGEIVDPQGQRRDIQLKGSGPSPFSRGGDGKTPMGPALREYLIAEAMHALKIATTRALAVVATGETVMRETPRPGAVLTRIAASHIRVGTFQFFAARRDTEKVRQLADYVIARHYPQVVDTKTPYLSLFKAVVDAQAALVAGWMRVGFIHGVMNTDNMTVSGETIDYGPCAFMDSYAPETKFSSIDEGGRYAYANQPLMAQWNLTRFAECLIELVETEVEDSKQVLSQAVSAFPQAYLEHWLSGMRQKIGLSTEEDGDLDLVNALFSIMAGQNVDYTMLFRNLASAALGDVEQVLKLFDEPAALERWIDDWQQRILREGVEAGARTKAMNSVNPIYIPRNHKVEEALKAAVEDQDFGPFVRLVDVVSKPFEVGQGLEAFAGPGPKTGQPYQTFCGT